MPKHKHQIRRDRVHERLEAVTQLGTRKIPTAMTWPVAEIKAALRELAEIVDDARQQIRDQYTVGRVIEGKFVPDVVYAKNEDGTPKFKTDAKGTPTEEREVEHGRVQLTNAVTYDRELREFNRIMAEIEIPHMSWPQLEGKVATLEPNIVESLMEYFDDVPKPDAVKPPARSAGKGAKAPEGAAT